MKLLMRYMTASRAMQTLLMLLLAAGLGACNVTKGRVPSEAEITGSATYRERIALPPGAIMTVQLQDQSLMDVAATVLAETTVELNTGPPYNFVLAYYPPQIVPGRRYGLSLRITVDDQLWFINDTHIPAFPEDGVDHEIVLRRAR